MQTLNTNEVINLYNTKRKDFIHFDYKPTTDEVYDNYNKMLTIKDLIITYFNNENILKIDNLQIFLKKYDEQIKRRLEEKKRIIQAKNVKQQLGNGFAGSFNYEDNYKGEVGELLVSYFLKGKNSINHLGKSDIEVNFKGTELKIQVKTMLTDNDPRELVTRNNNTFSLQEKHVHWHDWLILVLVSKDYNTAYIVMSENLMGSEIQKNYCPEYANPKNTTGGQNYTGRNYQVLRKEIVTLRNKGTLETFYSFECVGETIYPEGYEAFYDFHKSLS